MLGWVHDVVALEQSGGLVHVFLEDTGRLRLATNAAEFSAGSISIVPRVLYRDVRVGVTCKKCLITGTRTEVIFERIIFCAAFFWFWDVAGVSCEFFEDFSCIAFPWTGQENRSQEESHWCGKTLLCDRSHLEPHL